MKETQQQTQRVAGGFPMCGNMACIAAVLLGIDVGWQPRPEGGLVYLIQIEPELLETLKSGEPIQSDFPAKVKDVRGFQITVGRAELPRELPPAEVDLPDPAAAATDLPPADPFLPAPTRASNWPDTSVALPSLRQPGAESPPAPRTIEPTPDIKPINARQAGYIEGPSAVSHEESKSPSEQGPRQEGLPQEETEKPWTPLIVALFTLFGSLGANFYLGWITWNTRRGYRSLAEGLSHPELE